MPLLDVVGIWLFGLLIGLIIGFLGQAWINRFIDWLIGGRS